MAAVYALIVGINRYQALSVPRLSGCVNDATAVQAFLRGRVTTDLHDLILVDEAATRDAVIAGFRSHLGQAGPDDVALFWYSGHGSQQLTPEDFWFLEPTGFNSTIVLADSRMKGVADLADKELSLLIDEVAARGPHVAVVLDCCHSGGGTRDPQVALRGVEASTEAPTLSDYLPELAARARAGIRSAPATRDADAALTAGVFFTVGDHVALSACRSFEKAKEQLVDGRSQGVFTAALLGALKTLGAGATYRDLLGTAKCRVANSARDQVPVLFPVDPGGTSDQAFLGGSVSRPPAAFVLRHVQGMWEVDAGLCHGVPAVAGEDKVVLAVAKAAGSDVGRRLHLTEVRAESSKASPDGWTPDQSRQYPVVVTSVPLPPATVVVGGLEGDDSAALALVAKAVATAGPDGGPSPHVRIVDASDGAAGLRLRVSTIPPEGRSGPIYRILRGDLAATADVEGHSAKDARTVVARLEHIAQWSHVKDLENPASALAGAVTVEIVMAEPGETTAPKDRAALAFDGRGEIAIAYRAVGADFEPPRVFVRLRNTFDRRLWCVLLDLTDRFRIHAKLFPGDFIDAGGVGAALSGKALRAELPPGRPVVPGASVRDWFKLIVAEEQFGSAGYELPRLDEAPTRATRPVARGILERLGLAATLRDIGDDDEDEPAGDWATAVIPVVTVVPLATEGG